MSAVGTVVFSAADGYDSDVWDDTALIQEYDRALQSSRELVKKRLESKSGQSKKLKDWKLGDSCRAVYSEDGEVYEGTIVFKKASSKSVVVRFHGYNNEEEIKERELMESLGQKEVDYQMEQAQLDAEALEEEEGAGDDFQLGDWCRAEWSEDGVVYEAIIESLNRKSRTATVKFLGFGNVEEKSVDDLYLSKGEEWRLEQESFGDNGLDEKEIKEDDLHNLLMKNCPDLLANFGEANDIDLSSLTIEEEGKEKKKRKRKKNRKRIKSRSK